jgi:hypothetical protein
MMDGAVVRERAPLWKIGRAVLGGMRPRGRIYGATGRHVCLLLRQCDNFCRQSLRND